MDLSVRRRMGPLPHAWLTAQRQSQSSEAYGIKSLELLCSPTPFNLHLHRTRSARVESPQTRTCPWLLAMQPCIAFVADQSRRGRAMPHRRRRQTKLLQIGRYGGLPEETGKLSRIRIWHHAPSMQITDGALRKVLRHLGAAKQCYLTREPQLAAGLSPHPPRDRPP